MMSDGNSILVPGMLEMLPEEFPAIIILNVETSHVIDTGLETILFDRSQQLILERTHTRVEALRCEIEPKGFGVYFHFVCWVFES